MDTGQQLTDELDAELLIAGASAAGLSTAIQALRAGLRDVLILRLPGSPSPEQELTIEKLPIRHVTAIESIEAVGDGPLRVETGEGSFTARVCALDLSGRERSEPTPVEVPESIGSRVHTAADFDATGTDVLVVGKGEVAANATSRLAKGGARVVLSFGGRYENLCLISRQLLEGLERDQKVTILWQSTPVTIWDQDGYPMVGFGDRMTPDLQFDHVLFVTEDSTPPPELQTSVDDEAAKRLFVMGSSTGADMPGVAVGPAEAWREIRASAFSHLPPLAPRTTTGLDRRAIRELELEHYNATLTAFDTAHNELWRIRVRPDREAIAHRAGQYCSLGLGYWEPRADDATDPGLESKRHKLVRRSYSISSPMFDAHGYLADHAEMDEVELYIVWVQPDEDRTPALTPRLALKHLGDRLYLGPKVAGRYTVSPVTNPLAPVVFCATGTGEAPHNAMAVELLRKGHRGPILSVVTVRYWSDLAYLSEHRRLEDRFDNYRYLPVPTREEDVPKRYAQDLLADGTLEDELGGSLEPDEAHFFLCGNPAMIGLPEWVEDRPVFPETTGMAELLHEQGFMLDRRGSPGQVHYEEYW